jgi:predicted DNA-binding protein
MSPTATVSTSVRLPRELSRELARKARSTKRGKNWVIKEALELYLLGSSHDALRKEARRQSLLVSRQSTKDDADWTDQAAAETEGWSA